MAALATINLVGAGKVGQTVCRLARLSGSYEVRDILSRTAKGAGQASAFIGAGRPVGTVSEMRGADIWLLTVPDTMIAGMAAGLARSAPGPAIAIHCSGFLTAAEMRPLADAGWRLASAHPVFSFADPAISVAHFRGTLCGIEGDAPAASAARMLFETIGARSFPIRTEAKAIYHAAAVFSNNLTTVLQAVALEAWAEAGVSDEVIHELHAALLRSTVENVLALGPRAGLTGPAARGDLRVVAEQQAAIAGWHPRAAAVYERLSDMAMALKASGRTE